MLDERLQIRVYIPIFLDLMSRPYKIPGLRVVEVPRPHQPLGSALTMFAASGACPGSLSDEHRVGV